MYIETYVYTSSERIFPWEYVRLGATGAATMAQRSITSRPGLQGFSNCQAIEVGLLHTDLQWGHIGSTEDVWKSFARGPSIYMVST